MAGAAVAAFWLRGEADERLDVRLERLLTAAAIAAYASIALTFWTAAPA